MKKVLLLSLSLVLGFSAFAQQRVARNDVQSGTASAKKAVMGKEMGNASAAQFAPQTAKSVVMNRYQGELEYAATMTTNYDLQSNQFVANRMYQNDEGSVAVVATMSHANSATSAPDRGTGYNFYKSGLWQDEPEDRIEPFMAGWPSIAQWGERGEILLCHGNGHMNCFTREVAGDGEWNFMGTLPDYPEDYPYDEYPTWPRVITCGDNHNVIIAVAALQHSISSDETDVRTVIFRSEDAVNWTVSYSPLEEYGYHIDTFSADDYALAANGHTVALLYSGNLTNSVWMFKSTDDGLTWNGRRVWEHPYEGRSFEYENGQPWGFEDTLFIPMNGSIVVDKRGVAHVALNTHEIIHTVDNESGYYSYWSGRTVDGIVYWNDTQEGPIADTEHPEYEGTGNWQEELVSPNPHHAARLWWPVPGDPGYVHMVPDSTKWIGYIPSYQDEDGNYIQWDNDMFYNETDYYYRFYGASGHPALSCDSEGNLACAYSSPCTYNENAGATNYYRHIYVSYRNVDDGYWHQIVDDITDPEAIFELTESDNMFTVAAPNTVNPGEYWFGFQSDEQIGLAWGSGASQTSTTDNYIYVIKVNADPEMVSVPESTEAVDVIYGIYPNPATDYVIVKSSMDTEANINIFNLVGQNVKSFSTSLKLGENAISIDLQSGIYFCNIEANGFTKTIKFVVK